MQLDLNKNRDWFVNLIRGYWSWTRETFYPPDFRNNDEYRKAFAWLGEQGDCESDKGDGSDPALSYAWKRYEESTAVLESLDKKGDNLMKNTGLAAALIGVSVNTFHLDSRGFMLFTLVPWVVSLTLTTYAVSPKDLTTGPSIDLVVDDMKNKSMKDHILAGALHCAVVGRMQLNAWKASRLHAAHGWFCAGLIILALGVIATMIFSRPPVAL